VVDSLDRIGHTKLTLERLEAFIHKVERRRAKDVVAMMSKSQPFIESIRTELGQQLLKDVVARQAELLEKVYDGTLSEDDRHELRALKIIQERWETKIVNFIKVLDEINLASVNGDH
jgi:hypothetical protein